MLAEKAMKAYLWHQRKAGESGSSMAAEKRNSMACEIVARQ